MLPLLLLEWLSSLRSTDRLFASPDVVVLLTLTAPLAAFTTGPSPVSMTLPPVDPDVPECPPEVVDATVALPPSPPSPPSPESPVFMFCVIDVGLPLPTDAL